MFGSMVLPIAAVVRFSLAERKNEQQKEANVPLCMTTAGHRVRPVNNSSARKEK
jgi:hypothetical protein